MPGSTVYRWSQGYEPTLDNLVQVAEALHRPLIQILVAAGYVPSKDLSHEMSVPPRTPASLEQALRPPNQGGDPTLSPGKRELLRQAADSIDQIERGQKKVVSKTVTPARARRR